MNIYHPYLLKEYHNRWFLITKAQNGKSLTTLALTGSWNFRNCPEHPLSPKQE